jgi:hypothetical protein
MIIEQFQQDALRQMKKYRQLADNAVAQIDKDNFFNTIDNESNSIAIMMKHMAGNMISRWTDFLTTDGEKNRQRDLEFIITSSDSFDSINQIWEAGWETTLKTISSLTAADYEKTVYIRQEPHSVLEAINRQLTHYAYHVGQIVLLAKHFAEGEWHSLSIPKGKSEDYKIVNDEI